MNKNILIIIPARYASKRFPGKPLKKIAGKEMLLRVWENAQRTANKFDNIDAIVATDDQRIADFCIANSIAYVMTSESCRTGTERSLDALKKLKSSADFIINLQGDNPMCPPWFIEAMVQEYLKRDDIKVLTPCAQMTWRELDKLRAHKLNNPFSGTTVTFDKHTGRAYWFSKNIIPAIRDEKKQRENSKFSMAYRHIGLYGYSYDVLLSLPKLQQADYAETEGLEQLNFIQNNIPVNVIEVDYRDREGMSGVDSPEDVPLAEAIIEKYGEF